LKFRLFSVHNTHQLL